MGPPLGDKRIREAGAGSTVKDCDRSVETATAPPITMRTRCNGMKKSPSIRRPESNGLIILVEKGKPAEPLCRLAPRALLKNGFSQALPSIVAKPVA